MIRPLFFYGVLMPGLASGRMADLVALLGPTRPATVSERLFCGARSARTLSADGHRGGSRAGQRRGAFAGATVRKLQLAELDACEGFDPAKPTASDYVREPVHATLAGGLTLGADAYRWNRAIADDFIAIPHGDFARYLAEGGATPLPG